MTKWLQNPDTLIVQREWWEVDLRGNPYLPVVVCVRVSVVDRGGPWNVSGERDRREVCNNEGVRKAKEAACRLV